MAEYPCFPLWTDAYLADTTHLSCLEHGAYLQLLIAMWRSPSKSLPADDRQLAKFCHLTAGQWTRIRPTIMTYFRLADGRITQGRLTDEANAVRRNSTRQSDKAKARWLKENKTTDAAGMPDACRTDASLPLPFPSQDLDIENNPDTPSPAAVAPLDVNYFQTVQKLIEELPGSANCTHLGRIREWETAGADIELDVKPVLRRLGPTWSGKSIKYFDAAIADSITTRTAPMPVGRHDERAAKSDRLSRINGYLKHVEQGANGHDARDPDRTDQSHGGEVVAHQLPAARTDRERGR